MITTHENGFYQYLDKKFAEEQKIPACSVRFVSQFIHESVLLSIQIGIVFSIHTLNDGETRGQYPHKKLQGLSSQTKGCCQKETQTCKQEYASAGKILVEKFFDLSVALLSQALASLVTMSLLSVICILIS